MGTPTRTPSPSGPCIVFCDCPSFTCQLAYDVDDDFQTVSYGLTTYYVYDDQIIYVYVYVDDDGTSFTSFTSFFTSFTSFFTSFTSFFTSSTSFFTTFTSFSSYTSFFNNFSNESSDASTMTASAIWSCCCCSLLKSRNLKILNKI